MEERLYCTLMMDLMPGECEVRGLIEAGYLTEKLQHTQKAKDFINSFLDSKKEAVLEAIKEVGPEARRSLILEKAGIRQLGVFKDVADRLVTEGKLKKINKRYYPVD
ncbi:hypothetical protein Desca_2156 [Desulfotomaculum nigrificans CO-1-SRB]|uniref:Uncharacterized protein n=1 Tax=Desulfotomaculum nigrificans (strain DSM 14880 / VKM B-2319 / CO-1-SRB) TaxID=868595 RepID=F6BA26_DESCC|nr:hypothetical protein [Desulfotomaculum nigrificans]AEF94995.1 hypothetical protein Desca_2156 [Desulfotomaculum nigrificans CO-1-SRB]